MSASGFDAHGSRDMLHRMTQNLGTPEHIRRKYLTFHLKDTRRDINSGGIHAILEKERAMNAEECGFMLFSVQIKS